MRVIITAKARILPNTQERLLLDRTMSAYQKACNHVSSHVHNTRCTVRRNVHRDNYAVLRTVYGLPSQMSCSVIKTVLARYKALGTTRVNRKQGKWTEPRFSKSQLELCYNRDYTLRDDLLSINTLAGRIRVKYHDEFVKKYLTGEYKLGTAKLVRNHGKYYLYVPVAIETDELGPEDVSTIVGIDRGVNFLVATYDSNGQSGFVNGRGVKAKRAHYKNLRRELQRKGTPSARRRLKRIGKRENRWMNDVNHRISKALVTKYPRGTMFVLEDLTGIRNATEKVRVRDRYVMVSWAYYDLEQKLMYKARLNGQQVIKVDPRYTSQQCPKCSHTKRANRDKHTHLFTCKNCGYKSNDDRIAAMNLCRKGTESLGISAQSDRNTIPVRGLPSTSPDATSPAHGTHHEPVKKQEPVSITSITTAGQSQTITS